MDDVRGDFLGPPHGTTPAAVMANKNKTEILQLESSEHIFQKGDGPYRGFGYSSLVSEYVVVDTYWKRRSRVWCCRSLLGTLQMSVALYVCTWNNMVQHGAEDPYWFRCGRK